MGVSLMEGTVKCDWCGKYIKTRDNGAFDHVGIGWAINGIAGAKKHYCCRACKEAAEAANGEKGPSLGAQAASAIGGVVKETFAPVGEMYKSTMNESLKMLDPKYMKQMAEEQKERVLALKTHEFPEDPKEYKKEMLAYIEEYKAMVLNPSSSANAANDREYKEELKRFIEKELRKLQAKDIDMYEDLNDEFEVFMKKQQKKKKMIIILVCSFFGGTLILMTILGFVLGWF